MTAPLTFPPEPPRLPARSAAANIARLRQGTDTMIGRLRVRAEYLTDEQRRELLIIAEGGGMEALPPRRAGLPPLREGAAELLEALREHAPPDGLIRPRSAAEVAVWADISIPQCYRALARLEAHGLIEWQRGNGIAPPVLRLLAEGGGIETRDASEG